MENLSWEEIYGWFDFQNIYSDAVQNASDEDVFVEIGAYLGKSTIYMAKAIANSKKKIEFYVVDCFIGEFNEDNENLYERYLNNINKAEVAQYITTFNLKSELAAKKLETKKISFLFIDGDHSLEGIQSDIKNYLPLMKSGGTIAGHDYFHPPIKETVDTIFGNKVEIFGNSWVVKNIR